MQVKLWVSTNWTIWKDWFKILNSLITRASITHQRFVHEMGRKKIKTLWDMETVKLDSEEQNYTQTFWQTNNIAMREFYKW